MKIITAENGEVVFCDNCEKPVTKALEINIGEDEIETVRLCSYCLKKFHESLSK